MPQAPPPVAEFTVQAHPRSARNALTMVEGALHVWVTAPPADGAANAAIIALLAQSVGVPKSHVTILRGASARHKRVAIAGLTEDEARAKIAARPHP